MRIREQARRGCTVLELEGRLVSSEIGALVTTFEEIRSRSTLAVLVDLTQVPLADAPALRALAFLHESLLGAGLAMGLCGLQKQPATLMALLGLREPLFPAHERDSGSSVAA